MIGFNRFEQVIKIRYRASDGFTKMKTFKTLKGARKYCIGMLGRFPEFGSNYAVSGDGVGTIFLLSGSHVELKDLFGNDVVQHFVFCKKEPDLKGVSFEVDPFDEDEEYRNVEGKSFGSSVHNGAYRHTGRYSK